MTEDDGPITSVPRLLVPHDRAFIHAAYQAVLGRAPDLAGEAHYLAWLRSGTHKLAILRQLRRSAEGRAFVPGVAGLDRAIKRHGWATLPIVGVLVRLITGAEGNGATHRQLRVLANEMGRLRTEQFQITALMAADAQVRGGAEAPQMVPDSSARPASGTWAAVSVRRTGLAGFFQSNVWNR